MTFAQKQAKQGGQAGSTRDFFKEAAAYVRSHTSSVSLAWLRANENLTDEQKLEVWRNNDPEAKVREEYEHKVNSLLDYLDAQMKLVEQRKRKDLPALRVLCREAHGKVVGAKDIGPDALCNWIEDKQGFSIRMPRGERAAKILARFPHAYKASRSPDGKVAEDLSEEDKATRKREERLKTFYGHEKTDDF